MKGNRARRVPMRDAREVPYFNHIATRPAPASNTITPGDLCDVHTAQSCFATRPSSSEPGLGTEEPPYATEERSILLLYSRISCVVRFRFVEGGGAACGAATVPTLSFHRHCDMASFSSYHSAFAMVAVGRSCSLPCLWSLPCSFARNSVGSPNGRFNRARLCPPEMACADSAKPELHRQRQHQQPRYSLDRRSARRTPRSSRANYI